MQCTTIFPCMQACVAQLWARNVDLEAVLLKPMMVMAGGDAPQKTAPAEVARLTLDVMRRQVAWLHAWIASDMQHA